MTRTSVRLYHRTTSATAAAIMRDGFQDGVGHYLTTQTWRGVWLADRPLDANEGANGDTLLAVDLTLDDEQLSRYEWVEEGKGYREFLVPAAVVNQHPRVVVDEATDDL